MPAASVSAQGLGIHECAQLVTDMLTELGATVSTAPAPETGYPVIYAEIKGRSDRTVLFYDHYDVQPPEPLELWSSPPFEPTVREGRLYGRGVSDDKGSIAVRLAAIEAFVRAGDGLPCNVKFFIEGEEEIGSPHLASVVRDHAHLLKADGCIWEGGGVNWQGTPSISLGPQGNPLHGACSERAEPGRTLLLRGGSVQSGLAAGLGPGLHQERGRGHPDTGLLRCSPSAYEPGA